MRCILRNSGDDIIEKSSVVGPLSEERDIKVNSLIEERYREVKNDFPSKIIQHSIPVCGNTQVHNAIENMEKGDTTTDSSPSRVQPSISTNEVETLTFPRISSDKEENVSIDELKRSNGGGDDTKIIAER